MCGIAGFTKFTSIPGDEGTLLNMGNAILHRGPDAHGEYLDEYVGLCHRRLSIIDLSELGRQPMFSFDDNLVLVFNGEIYNYQELRADLVAKGYPFRSQSDTEVILALYHYEGESFINKIHGMFALALWDKQKQSLFLARDRLGKKPLYYFTDGKQFVFGSEIKALLQVDCVPKEIRADAVYDFFAYQYIPDPKTIFKNIYKLKPGHWLKVDPNGLTEGEYWDVSFDHTSSKSEAELKDELLHRIDQCTKERMVSDVPLGAFLSGGVDSSGVVALMAKGSQTPITTCSIGFDEKKFNETEFAAIVAKQYQCNHKEYFVRESVEQNLEHIVKFFDEPFADPSLVPTFFVSQLARQAVTVALAGDGGDEIFAGYEKYSSDFLENKLRGYFPSAIRQKLFPAIGNSFGQSSINTIKRAGSLLNSLSLDPAEAFYVSNSHMPDSAWNQLATDEFKANLNGYHPSQITTTAYAKSSAHDHLGKILYTDIKTYLPGGILVKVDRMSMANSLEVRAPLLDHQIVEFAATLPSSLKFNNGEKKYLLKECFKPLLPNDILYRKKMGFSVPLAKWLKEEINNIAKDYLFKKENGLHQFFQPQEIEKLWQEHQQGKKDHAAILWSMLMFAMWFTSYMQVNGRQSQYG